MPTFVHGEKCDGCEGRPEAFCAYICPHDLMRLDRDGTLTGHAGKSFNQEPDQCWECYACVKLCPQQAIEVRPYADVVPLGACVQPLRGSNSISWRVGFRNGIEKHFEFPIRTTPEGSIDPYGDKPEADLSRIGKPGFFVQSGGYRAGDPEQLLNK
ncbi:MAG: adenylyl-sulfate reductase subunit beta [Gammaproteobacteria bacterium]|nr:adenylyl-sulfate reductase subunit beta [Gammaproteobacteria bacterium]